MAHDAIGHPPRSAAGLPPAAPPTGHPAAAVLLRHTLASGDWHYDWMIERRGDPREHRLVAFRARVDPLRASAPFAAIRIADHRARYLAYEGDIGGGRGRVERIWSGHCVVTRSAGGAKTAVRVRSEGATADLVGMPCRADMWVFVPADR